MRLHYSDTHEHVQVGDQTITPDGMDIKIIAIYEHSGAILVEVLNSTSARRRRGATADEIGADWRGGLFERNVERFFSKLPANEFYTATPTDRLHDPKPEIQGLPLQTLHNFRPQAEAADIMALELRLAPDASFIIPIDEADRQRLLDGLAMLISMDTLAGQPERDAEQKAIQELAAHLRKV